MAYYSKEEVMGYVNDNLQEIETRGLRPLNPKVEVEKRLNDEEELVAFFWLDYKEEENEGEKVKMEGKCWYRVNHNLYTDDRFAIDLYQAMVAGITVTDVIQKREHEKELARQGIVDVTAIESKIKENIDKEDGTKGTGSIEGV